MDNQLMYEMITEQIAILKQSILGAVISEFSVMRTMLQYNSDHIDNSLFALEDRIRMALSSPAIEVQGRGKCKLDADVSKNKANEKGKHHSRHHDSTHEVGIAEVRAQSTSRSHARLAIAVSTNRRIVTTDSISQVKTGLSYRRGLTSANRAKHDLEISTLPHIKQDVLTSVPRRVKDTSALPSADSPRACTKLQLATPAVDIDPSETADFYPQHPIGWVLCHASHAEA
jgi:hypothetical protein